MATAKQLSDVMECPICIEVFTDPRLLPCVHTYCLKCIKAWRDEQSGDILACPVCRKEFTLPSSGAEGLPKNFYVANFLQMKELSDNIAAGVDKCREMWESLEKEKSEFVEQVEKTGVEISEKAEQLKRMIDDHREKLMSELSLMKQKRMKEIESVHEEIERQLLSMESYKKYVDEVRQKGTACDIARAASGLHDRAEELLKFDAIERTLDDLGHPDVTFVSSDSVVDDVGTTLGQLKLKSAGNSNYFHCTLALEVDVGCDTVICLLFVPRCLSV